VQCNLSDTRERQPYAWGTFELLKPENAEQLRLLRCELDEVLGDKPFPDYADMLKLPYLERCFHESMRLYPQPPVELALTPGGCQITIWLIN
jgi:cytochrome P450